MLELDLILKANLSNATQGLNELSRLLAVTGTSAITLGDRLDKVGTGLNKLQQQVRAFGGGVAAFNRPMLTLNDTLLATPRALNAASTAVQKSSKDFTNLSRVIQDLPFGFIGIQNNITQLIPGVGALGLVISAITSAITFAQVGTSAWTRGLGSAKEKISEAEKEIQKIKDSLESFNDSLKTAESGAISQGVSLQKYVEIARDSTKSLEERNFALDKANKILGEHGEKLTLVNINTAAATEEVNKFTQALIQQALAAKFADRIAELIVRQKDQLIDYNKALEDVNKARDRVKLPGNEDVLKLYDKLKEAYRGQNTTANAYNETLVELKLRMRQMSEAAGQSVDLFADLGTKSKETEKTLKSVSSILDDLNKQFTFLNAIETNQGLDKAEEKIKAIEDAIKSLIDIGQDPAGGLIQNLFGGISEQALPLAGRLIEVMNKKFKETPIDAPVELRVTTLDFTKDALDFALVRAQLEDLSKRFKIELPINFGAMNLAELKAALDTMKAPIEKFQEDVGKIMEELRNQLIVGFAEGIGKALAGENVGDIFKGLFSIIGGALKQLGQTMITVSGLMKAIKVAFSSLNPVLAAAAGFALIALGSFIQAKAPKLASGGIVPPGYPNDSFPAFLQSNEAVIPLDRINDFLRPSAASQPIVLTPILRGSDIYLQQQRYASSVRRGR